jgi:hypothetical protein
VNTVIASTAPTAFGGDEGVTSWDPGCGGALIEGSTVGDALAVGCAVAAGVPDGAAVALGGGVAEGVEEPAHATARTAAAATVRSGARRDAPRARWGSGMPPGRAGRQRGSG